jgi:hypothetical protein
MVAVGIVALDLAVMRAMVDSPRVRFLVVGGLPMAHVLGGGLLIARRCPEARPFLLGFEVFGLAALALLAAVACSLPSCAWAIRSYLVVGLRVGLRPVAEVIGRDRPLVLIPVAAFGMIVMLAWPQAAFALVGGFLSRGLTTLATRR